MGFEPSKIKLTLVGLGGPGLMWVLEKWGVEWPPLVILVVGLVCGAMLIMAAALWIRDAYRWLKAKDMGTMQIILIIGLIGTWLFLTAALAAGTWAIWKAGGIAQAIGAQTVNDDEGPLSWWTEHLSVGWGDGQKEMVRSLAFRGTNISQEEIELRSAEIRSAINGTKHTLEVVASDGDEYRVVPLDHIELIPPGARIELVASFEPNIPTKQFLETWRQFNLVVTDSVRTYRSKYDEKVMMVLFEGKVGPRVTVKKEYRKNDKK
ncbi:MAG: hypothetical protein WD852_08870 [Methyloceanibacter sp.]